MDEEFRPALRSYEQWKVDNANHWSPVKCDCYDCYIFHHVDDRIQLSMVDGPSWKLEKAISDSFKRHRNSNCPRMLALGPVKHHKGNGKPKGLWAGTLTMAPTDPYNEDDMVMAIRKLFKQETCPVEKYAWYLEYTGNDLPHIHFCYRTPNGNRIHAKVFKRVWKLWDENVKLGAGHKGGYHRLVSDEDAYLKYIAKDKGRHESNWSID